MVTVSIAASDPNGVASMTLRYSVNGGAFANAPMTLADGRYSATIGAQAANAVVQFYVEGQDGLGATSVFPADGAASRALYKVGTTTNSTTLHNLQIIMTTADSNFLNASTNLMSNDRMGATVIYQGRAYYDVGVRLKGSEHGRPADQRRGYFLYFPPDNLFRGIHRSVGLDRSGGWRYGRQFGQEEILIHHFINRAGDVPGSYNDLVFVEAPGVATNTAILQMGRFTNLFLDSQYENGGDGTRYEYELVYTLLPSVAGDVESLKAAQEGPSVFGVAIRDQGDDRESYRNNFLIKNNTDEDTYQGILDLAEAFTLPAGPAFHERTAEVLDVDQWLRAFAAVALAAVSDSYFNNSNAHNATFYRRPDDGKMLLFPQDMDFAFINGATSSLVANNDLSKLLTLPHNSHFYLGHIQDIVSTSFNQTYIAPWVAHYNSLLPGQNITDLTAFINSRATFALSQLPGQVAFDVSATPPTPVTTTLIQEFASAKALVPSVANGGSTLGTTWTETGFYDAGWGPGGTGVGYQTEISSDNIDYEPLLNLDTLGMFETNGSVFVRVPFTVPNDPATYDTLKLRMKYDDGFVAYLNGVRLTGAQANTPASPAWNSLATASHDDPQAIVFQEFDISAFRHLLVQGGNNVLAIHGMNVQTNSSDMLILPQLIAEDIPSGGGGEIIVNEPSVVIGGTGWVNVREIRVQGQPNSLPVRWTSNTAWQATVQLEPGTHVYTFEAFDFRGNSIGTDTLTITSTVPRPLVDHLRISELMYHPADPTSAEIAQFPNVTLDADDFEFVELVNNSPTETLTLNGASFADGIEFTFAATALAPGARTVVVRNQAAFQARYGTSIPIAGTYDNDAFNNAGEHVLLLDADGGTVLDFTYDDTGDGWHPTTDGAGYSLVIVSENGPVADWNSGAGWRPSQALGGSPGQSEPTENAGDINLDNRVDAVDLTILQANIGTTTGADRAHGDLNGDGAVNRADAAIVAVNYGRSYSPSPPASPSAAVVSRAEPPSSMTASRRRIATRRIDPAAVDFALSSHETSVSRLPASRTRRTGATSSTPGGTP